MPLPGDNLHRAKVDTDHERRIARMEDFTTPLNGLSAITSAITAHSMASASVSNLASTTQDALNALGAKINELITVQRTTGQIPSE